MLYMPPGAGTGLAEGVFELDKLEILTIEVDDEK